MAFIKKLNLDKLKETVESGAKAAKDNLANLDAEKIGKSVESGIKVAQKGLSEADTEAVAKKAKDLAATGAEGAEKLLKGLKGKRDKKDQEQPDTLKDFVSLLWCLANEDGAITDEERSQIGKLASGMDEKYESYASEIEKELLAQLKKDSDEFGCNNAAKMKAKQIIESMELTQRDAKLLCWNLLAVANVDGLEQSELDFIRFVSERSGLDAAVFEEFRNYNDAIAEIEQLRTLLKESNRSYGEIEPQINELEKREQKIIEAAQALITDR